MTLRHTIFLFCLVSSYLSFAGVPHYINYQGYLTDSAGPVSDGVYNITFTIYDEADLGTALWAETQAVSAQSGLYAVSLGAQTPLTAEVFAGERRYLGIKVGSDPEMIPRKRIVSVAYAMTSDAVSGEDNILPGTGNVGIGLKTPQVPLDIQMPMRSHGSAAFAF